MEWQPIETAPRDGTEVIVFTGGGVVTAWHSVNTGMWPHDCEFTEDGEACNVGLPTHWMPLPAPPLEASQ